MPEVTIYDADLLKIFGIRYANDVASLRGERTVEASIGGKRVFITVAGDREFRDHPATDHTLYIHVLRDATLVSL